MQYVDTKIKEFSELFKGRLNADLLQDAIYYVDCNKRGLAFETICDHISEYEVPITKAEYDMAINICKELKIDTNDISIKDMLNLVID